MAVTWDIGSNDFFIADRDGHTIYRVADMAGANLTAVVGGGTAAQNTKGDAGHTGTSGFPLAEENDLTTTGTISYPGALVRDPALNLLYFTDDGNNRIRMVNLNGAGTIMRFGARSLYE